MCEISNRALIALIVGAALATGCAASLEEGGSASPTAPSSNASSSSGQGSSSVASSASSDPVASSPDRITVRGVVGNLTGNCTSGISFELRNERIFTNSNSEFRRIACSAIRNGTVVEVDGFRQADRRILARQVEFEEAQVPPAPAPNVPTEVEGIITGLSNGCPNLTFNIGSTRIRTNGTTEFNRIPCSSLVNGMDVEVEGVVQSDGVLLAREVQPDELTIRSAIAAPINGACPERSFMVNGQRVLTLVTTRFDDTTCAALQAQMRVEVRGVRRPDGSLLATRVRPLENRGRDEDDDDDEEVRVRGSLAALNGACPTRSFTVAGQPATTHAGTRFDDVSCGGLASGMDVEVRGVRQSNGSILASRVKRED
jgi:Domain of unknown function (DUF5666)